MWFVEMGFESGGFGLGKLECWTALVMALPPSEEEYDDGADAERGEESAGYCNSGWMWWRAWFGV